jgi:hypothetical protein
MDKKISCYSGKELQKMASDTLRNYRKVHRDRIRRYIFAEIPWHVSVSNEGASLNVQIMNRETGWTENTNIAL